jgi:Tfp pilus assembly protein PilF
VILFTGCSSQQRVDTTEEVVVSVPEQVINDYSDYAAAGLLIVDESYQNRFGKALTAIKNKKNSQALLLLDKLIVARPELTSARLNKAKLLEVSKAFEKSLNELQIASNIDPYNPAICNSYGRMLRLQGKFQMADKHYQRCLSFEKQSAVVHKNYGILLDLYLHKPELALQHYQAYMDKTGNKDRQVKGWILDLKRRIKRKGS